MAGCQGVTLQLLRSLDIHVAFIWFKITFFFFQEKLYSVTENVMWCNHQVKPFFFQTEYIVYTFVNIFKLNAFKYFIMH